MVALRTVSGRGAWGLAGLVLAVLCAAPGCALERTTTVTSFSPEGEMKERTVVPKPACSTTRPTRIMTFWQPNVTFAADPTRNGAPNAGLSCRMWLFDESVGHPMYYDGTLTVDLYDCSPLPTGETPVKHLEQWNFKPDVLRMFKKMDILGDGYTMFLPWASYRPNVTRVQMKLRFDPADGGAPLFDEPTMISLGSSVGDIRTNAGPVGRPKQ